MRKARYAPTAPPSADAVRRMDLEGDAGLADAARAGEGEQAHVGAAQQGSGRGEVGLTADQRCGLGRQRGELLRHTPIVSFVAVDLVRPVRAHDNIIAGRVDVGTPGRAAAVITVNAAIPTGGL